MKNIIFRRDGKLTKGAFWLTLLIILAVGYIIIGSLIASLQEGMPLRTK